MASYRAFLTLVYVEALPFCCSRNEGGEQKNLLSNSTGRRNVNKNSKILNRVVYIRRPNFLYTLCFNIFNCLFQSCFHFGKMHVLSNY